MELEVHMIFSSLCLRVSFGEYDVVSFLELGWCMGTAVSG